MVDVDDASQGPAPRVFFDASPGMVHDLPGEPDDSARVQSPEPQAAAVPAEVLAARQAEVADLAKAADGLPYGSDVGVALTRAAQEAGASAEEAASVTEQWLGTFAAHGIAQNDTHALIGVGLSLARDGVPSEETEAQWVRDARERLAREYGGQEQGERAAALAAAYVGRDRRLMDWLEETRLGSHPRVVLAIAKAAHNARRAGKF